MAKKRFALFPEAREQECDHPLGFPYAGSVPCTGPRKCPLCGTGEEEAEEEADMLREEFNVETAG